MMTPHERVMQRRVEVIVGLNKSPMFMGQREKIETIMRQHGLFLAPLNNGDWMAGRANVIYSLGILTAHYADPRLSIGRTAMEALEAAAQKVKDHGV